MKSCDEYRDLEFEVAAIDELPNEADQLRSDGISPIASKNTWNFEISEFEDNYPIDEKNTPRIHTTGAVSYAVVVFHSRGEGIAWLEAIFVVREYEGLVD